MTSRERVARALKKQPVDRVPVFMWFHPDTRTALSRKLEIPESRLDDVMGNDVKQTWVNNNYAMEGIVHEREGETHTDAWGIEWVKRYGFNQIKTFPLEQASRGEVLDYVFPHERIDELMGPMTVCAAGAKDYFLGCDVSPCIFEMYWRLRGMEMALIDFAFDPELAGIMMERCADFSIALAEKAMTDYRLDWLWTGDDVASQLALIMSPSAWRELIKPHMKRVFEAGRKRGLPVAYHCCGALKPIIPDLIESGLNVLNPVQSLCPGMNPLELKKEFGASLAFMGGVDTQNLLPKGTEDEVRRAAAGLIEGMTADGGGFILAATHTIPPETPHANIFALYREAGLTKEMIFDRAAEVRSKKK